jgi:hypothetical protein
MGRGDGVGLTSTQQGCGPDFLEGTMATILINGEKHVVNQCGTCAVWHTVPEIIYDTYVREGGFWSCPNGHKRGFRKGTEEVERDKIRRERDQLKQDAARLNEELATERKRAEDAERKTVQMRRRAAAGVCPCCNRTFLNVQRHMKTKHANVVPLEQKTA